LINLTFIYYLLFIVLDILHEKWVFVGRKSLWTVNLHFMDWEKYFGISKSG